MSGRHGLAATFRAAVADAAANRRALVGQAAVMALNDLVWVAFWIMFFRGVGTVGGWDADRILVLQAVLTTAGGIALGVLADARRVGSLIVEGSLDAVLALPVPPLAHLLLRRVEPVNLGDLGFGLVLFAVVGHPTPARVAVFVAVVAASTTLMVGVMVLAGSLAFFTGRGEGGELGFHTILLLGAYPVDVFSGTTSVLLHTVVPAAFVSTVPAKLVLEPSWGSGAALATSALTFALAGWATFHLGLRRYTSGSTWVRR